MAVEMKIYHCRFSDVKHYGEDWTHVEALDAEDAAEVFAEQSDQDGDYDIVKRGDAECPIEVKGVDGAITRWGITAETVNRYYAEPVEP